MSIKRKLAISLCSLTIIANVSIPVKASMVTYVGNSPVVVSNQSDDENDKPITWIDFIPILIGGVALIGCKMWSSR